MKIMKELSAFSAPLMIEESECSLCSRWQKLRFNFIWFHLAARVAPAHRTHKSLWLHSPSIFSQKPLKATKFSMAPHEEPNGCHSSLDRAQFAPPPPNKISHFTKEYLSKQAQSVWCQCHYFSPPQVSLPRLKWSKPNIYDYSRSPAIANESRGWKEDLAVFTVTNMAAHDLLFPLIYGAKRIQSPDSHLTTSIILHICFSTEYLRGIVGTITIWESLLQTIVFWANCLECRSVFSKIAWNCPFICGLPRF